MLKRGMNDGKKEEKKQIFKDPMGIDDMAYTPGVCHRFCIPSSEIPDYSE